MIKLTGTSGIAIYVNPDQIVGVNTEVNKGGSFVQYNGDAYVVSESVEEVVRKIMDYKLAMVRYAAASNAFASHGSTDMTIMSDYAEGDLNRLAELEQTP